MLNFKTAGIFFACDATTTMFAAPVKVDVETANIALP